MDKRSFNEKLTAITKAHKELVKRRNPVDGDWYNGVFTRYEYPCITNEHTPLFWRYDLNERTNPGLLERMGINCAFNPGAIEYNGKVLLVVRVEGHDRKSFFAIAESENGIDNFIFRDKPILLPQTNEPDVNVYDMRLTKHEDGWIYGIFCTERKDPKAPEGDMSSAVAQCGVVRTKDMKNFNRLPDIKTPSPQQRNVVLHPEFVDGTYALYTRPQDGFIQTGKGGGIGWGLCESMENPVIQDELVLDGKEYHTIKEVKNGQGPAPIKTGKGWLHIAHGVRNTAAGLRYVLYAFLTDLDDPTKIIARPAGHIIAPYKGERVGDVSNVVFCNGVVVRENGEVFIYYASSDTRCHTASTTVDALVDYVLNTPEDGYYSHKCVESRIAIIDKNLPILKDAAGGPLAEIKALSGIND